LLEPGKRVKKPEGGIVKGRTVTERDGEYALRGGSTEGEIP